MAKKWAGRTAGVTDPVADDFNSSIRFDSRMYREDITGSMAHAAMLGATYKLLTTPDRFTLMGGLAIMLVIGGVLLEIVTRARGEPVFLSPTSQTISSESWMNHSTRSLP